MFVRPYKGLLQRLPVRLKLPADLPEGDYTATVCDDLANARAELRDNPNLLSNPPDLRAGLPGAGGADARPSAPTWCCACRCSAVGVALDGKSLPNLPPSMVQILGNSRRTGARQ